MVHLKYNSLEFVKTFSASAADIKQFAKLDLLLNLPLLENVVKINFAFQVGSILGNVSSFYWCR